MSSEEYISIPILHYPRRFANLREAYSQHEVGTTEAVLNAFHLAETEGEREIRFRLSEIGLPECLCVHSPDAPLLQKGEEVTLWVRLPALGHRLFRLQTRR